MNATNATAVNTTGNLVVSSIPSESYVYVDYFYKGRTPLTITSLSIGNHRVSITRTGYSQYLNTTVPIHSGQTTSINATLVSN